MRIVLTAEGTRGDLHPLLALGGVFRAHGHEVVVHAPDNFREAVLARGMEFHPAGTDVVAYLERNAHALVHGGTGLLRAQFEYLDVLARSAFRTLPEAVRGADLLLAAGVQIAAHTAAELCGVPYRYVAYCPALLPSDEHAPATMPFQGLPRWLNRLLWRFGFPASAWPVLRRVNRCRRALGLAPARDPLRYMLGPRPVLLAADTELAPLPPDCRIAADQVGAFQADAEGALPEKLQAFLAAGPAPVFIGFGSMTDPAPHLTTDAVLEAVDRAGFRAVLSAGWARLGDGPLPESVLPVGAVSHARLFPHVAAVVHHGGAGTTTTAARAGVPQVVVPHVMDQFYWCRRLTSLGLAPPAVRRRRLDSRALADAIVAVADNEIVRERAALLGARLRHADPLRPENHAALLARVLGAV